MTTSSRAASITSWRGPLAGLLRLLPLAALFLSVTACDQIQALIGGGGPQVVEEANNALKDGDLPAAAAQYEELAAAHPDSVHVAIGRAYMQLLRGDTAGADATLAAVEDSAGELLPEIKLRRAIVALEAGDLDAMKAHGVASGLPEGKLLAAEYHIVEFDDDRARALLQEVAPAGGTVGAVASEYLRLLDGDELETGLALAAALWATGERRLACGTAEELVKVLPEDDPTKPAQLLLWAGRAATSGEPTMANNLLDELSFPPEGQAWRVQATRAIAAAAEGNVDEAVRIFDALAEGGAPADGLADARATACALVGDRAAAKRLVEGLESPAVARCLYEAGAKAIAPSRAPDGPLKTYLENQP